MSAPFIPTRNATLGSNAAPTTAALTNTGQMAINAYTGTMYMRKEDNTISDIVGDRLSGFRNRIINGNMVIDQRNNGSPVSLTGPANTYTLDRWTIRTDTGGVITADQSPTSLQGQTQNLLVTVTTADTSLGATQIYDIAQRIEGYNVADLLFGTASAEPITISFWVTSSLTGTFGGAVQNADGTRSYPFSYTITLANTFEYKTITIPGDTSGTWNRSSGIGLQLIIGLGTGSTYSGTAGAWVGSNIRSVTEAVNVLGTVGATFTLTGVQLEKGSVATPFEQRDYGFELLRCQRYFAKGTAVSSLYAVYGAGFAAGGSVSLPVTMRASPTLSISSIIGTGITTSSVGITYVDGSAGIFSLLYNTSSAIGTLGLIQSSYTANAEL
jgi:hypothetical protein